MIPSNHRQAERLLIRFVRDGFWTIDSDGRIWRGDRRAEKRVQTGYLMVRRMVAGKRIVGLAHRLVWQDAHGDIPGGLVINHINGNKSDNRLCNLEVATYSDNAKHACAVLGTNPQQGHLNNAAKLSPSDVAEIRAARSRGERAVDIARRFGVRYQHVYRVCNGERWPHLKAPADLRIREFPVVSP
jgi:hypothetical protein